MAGIPDSFSTFLTSSGDDGGGSSSSSIGSSTSPAHTGDILKLISDGHEHSIDDIREKLELGLREVVDTVTYLEMTGILTVRQDTSSKPPKELVKLNNLAS